MLRQVRRRAGMPKSKRHAMTVPPAENHGMLGRAGRANARFVAGVVEMVRVAIPALLPVMLAGLVEPKLRVGRYCAPVGLEAIAAVKTTAPAKPPAGVTVMANVFPVVAPRVIAIDVPPIVKLGFTAAVIVYVAVETGLLVKLVAVAIASIVSVLLTVIGVVYLSEVVVGRLPSVV
jgi:hypothetical protein